MDIALWVAQAMLAIAFLGSGFAKLTNDPLMGIAPAFTPLAAVGFVGLMIGAIITHLRRGERQLIIINVVLMLLALFVAWGRGVEVLLGNDAG
jgi:uncharacterized membrane protein YphA (DoxX/SURF4 family)